MRSVRGDFFLKTVNLINREASCTMESDNGLPTLDEFLVRKFPFNAYIDYPGFDDLYVRKADVVIRIADQSWRCVKVITVANVSATKPGAGAFAELVKDLLERDFAIYVENAHNTRFALHLMKVGFAQVNMMCGPNFLYGQKGHMEIFEK